MAVYGGYLAANEWFVVSLAAGAAVDIAAVTSTIVVLMTTTIRRQLPLVHPTEPVSFTGVSSRLLSSAPVGCDRWCGHWHSPNRCARRRYRQLGVRPQVHAAV